MTQLSEKELSAIKDLLSEEELLVKKFQMLAEHAQTPELKEKMTQISNQHRDILMSFTQSYLRRWKKWQIFIQKKKF